MRLLNSRKNDLLKIYKKQSSSDKFYDSLLINRAIVFIAEKLTMARLKSEELHK